MERREPPTPVAKQVLRAVETLAKKSGETWMADVHGYLGWPWPNSTKSALDQLEEKGWIERSAHRRGLKRAIRIRKASMRRAT